MTMVANIYHVLTGALRIRTHLSQQSYVVGTVFSFYRLEY